MKDQLTPLKETGIYIVELPIDSIEINFDTETVIDYYFNDDEIGTIYLPEGNWQLLGTFTKDKISFDPAPYIEDCPYYAKMWRNYNKEGKYPVDDAAQTAIESFYILLASCGYYWVNPLIEPDKFDYSFVECEAMQGFISTKGEINYNKLLQEWQSFEYNLVKGILLALIKK